MPTCTCIQAVYSHTEATFIVNGSCVLLIMCTLYNYSNVYIVVQSFIVCVATAVKTSDLGEQTAGGNVSQSPGEAACGGPEQPQTTQSETGDGMNE